MVSVIWKMGEVRLMIIFHLATLREEGHEDRMELRSEGEESCDALRGVVLGCSCFGVGEVCWGGFICLPRSENLRKHCG